MAVLVTGGAGFVGLNVVQAVLARGDDVVLFDGGALPRGAERALAPWSDYLFVKRGDVLDRQQIDALFDEYFIDRVIHAAAVTSGPDREARDPATIIDVNLRGTINVLEVARKRSVKRTIYIGSGAAYGESLYRLPRLYEESPAAPTTIYSITKHAAERMCLRMKALWKIDVVCVRLGTVIGPWERDTGVRDNFGTHSQLAAMALRAQSALLTSREIQRDWVYALDVANALVVLLNASHPLRSVYNVSSGVTWQQPIAAWCEALSAAYPKFEHRVARENEQPNIWYTDRDRGVMDIGRLSRDIGFTPQYQMQNAYAHYLDWMKRTPEFFQ